VNESHHRVLHVVKITRPGTWTGCLDRVNSLDRELGYRWTGCLAGMKPGVWVRLQVCTTGCWA